MNKCFDVAMFSTKYGKLDVVHKDACQIKTTSWLALKLGSFLQYGKIS